MSVLGVSTTSPKTPESKIYSIILINYGNKVWRRNRHHEIPLVSRHLFYGSRKMTVYLNRKNISVNRKRIQRLMRLMGLESIAPKPNTGRQRKGHSVSLFAERDDYYRT